MFEHCISAGPGTLLDYGMFDGKELPFAVSELEIDMSIRALREFGQAITFAKEHNGNRLIAISEASPDCTTGE